jgi:hypothetical protein
MKYLPAILLFVIGFIVTAEAQTAQSGGAKVTAEIIATSSTAIVKGAPFSAEAISESVQVLADGNKISRSFTTRMFRDGEGRFRREGGGSGAVGSGGSGFTFVTGSSALGFQDTISIFDPVSNLRYILNPSTKTTRRMSVHPGTAEGAFIVNSQSMSHAVKTQIETNVAKQTHVIVQPTLAATAVVGGFSYATNNSTGKSESLGTRNFEGVEAEGTRTTTTIAAGTIGNERDIEIIYERWYSKDLQLIVHSRHSDPRFGEQIYRLTNINRSEPDRSLFTPPADYKIVAEQTFNVVTTKPR